MNYKLATLLSMALGAVLIVSPSLTSLGDNLGYDTALAAKGGNSNGKGNGAANGGGNNSKGGGKSASAGGTSNVNRGKSKALSDPSAHPSMLGRWNSAKPIEHPAIQAHIRKGKFNGTIGMVAFYIHAQNTYDSYQQSLAEADPSVSALASALIAADYKTVEEYNAAVLAGEPSVPAIDDALAGTTGETTTPMTEQQIDQAEALADQGATAFDDLTQAETNMEDYSNRAPWSQIREAVRVKMGLAPTENDLVSEAPTDPAAPVTP